MDRDKALKLLRGGEDGVAEWNRRREEGEEIPILERADLPGADMGSANLHCANLIHADLIDADLNGANLSGATLSHANLRRASLRKSNLHDASLILANLSGANLSRAELSGANLSHANLHDAVLSEANLSEANLIGANLSKAVLTRTMLGSLDLSVATSLSEVEHEGPSTLGIDTLQKSNGKIPDDFLRGCGLSPWEVEMAKLYNPELTAHEVVDLVSTGLCSKRTDGPLYLGGVFISYSHSEKGIADKLRQRLHDAGASVWLDRHDAVAGNLNKQIQREIRLRDIVVLILSDTSVKSDWVEHELKSARTKEKEEERDVLCPIAVDDSWKSMLSNPNWGHLSDKLILDFSSWKTKAFDKQFGKLLKGMKINYEVRK